MRFLYNIGIHCYGFCIRIAAIFNPKAKQWTKGRKNLLSRIRQSLKHETRPIIWIHCASLGEFEQGRPIIEALHRQQKDIALVLTFFSPSGYEIRKNYPNADFVFYLPLDTSRNAKQFINIVNPSLIIFVKYEFWINYLSEIKNKKIPAILMSAKFREQQLFFKHYGKFYRNTIFAFEHIFVQDEVSASLLKKAGYSTVTIAGDTRFDRVTEIANHAKQFPLIAQFTNEKQTVVMGSSWEKDEQLMAKFFNTHPEKDLRLIIAPHEINSGHLKQIKRLFAEPVLFFSQLTTAKELAGIRILIIDKIGLLSSIYQYGKIAYIGGGFGKGIHNILEAATYGLPVVFGPNYHKFSEAVNLIALGGAFVITNQESLNKLLDKLLNNSERTKESGAISKKFVIENCGATQRILDHIFNIQKKVLTKFS